MDALSFEKEEDIAMHFNSHLHGYAPEIEQIETNPGVKLFENAPKAWIRKRIRVDGGT